MHYESKKSYLFSNLIFSFQFLVSVLDFFEKICYLGTHLDSGLPYGHIFHSKCHTPFFIPSYHIIYYIYQIIIAGLRESVFMRLYKFIITKYQWFLSSKVENKFSAKIQTQKNRNKKDCLRALNFRFAKQNQNRLKLKLK